MPSRAGWTTPAAKGRPSSSGWQPRRHSSREADRFGAGRALDREGLELDRPAAIDREIALRHAARAKAFAGHLGAADAIDLIEPLDRSHQALHVLGEKTDDTRLDHLRRRDISLGG